MATQLVTLQYNDQISVEFTNDVWFNATAVAKNFGKLPNEWLRLESTQDYIQKLTNFLLRENPAIKNDDFTLSKTQRGRHNSGTWFHPKLAIAFARWLDTDFAIWCDMQIEKLLHPKPYGLLESATINKAQIGEICCRVDEIALASEDSAKVKPAIWSRFKNHFRISGYKELSVDKYQDALAYIEKLRDEYASGKRMILIDASEYERLIALPNPSKTGEILDDDKIAGVQLKSGKYIPTEDFIAICNELGNFDYLIVPKKPLLELKKALRYVF